MTKTTARRKKINLEQPGNPVLLWFFPAFFSIFCIKFSDFCSFSTAFFAFFLKRAFFGCEIVK